MIRNIHIDQYRKLKDISLDFSPTVNAISGTNGTCKSSLLHLFSNSFQAVTKGCDWVIDKNCLPIIAAVNATTNPKVESLTRGDKEYNDPASGIKGTLFNIEYFDREPLRFRRHNSSIASRYAVKPKYQPGTHDSLPYCPVIYLGLSRLFPFGEFKNDAVVQGIKKNLPEQYQQEIAHIYKEFTHLSISKSSTQQMGDVKTRFEFSSDTKGVDSNTISAGEDNLYIILTALMSLRYYFESIQTRKTVESVLLVDELDATLHPAFQIKLFQVIKEYAKAYKIQVVFTTHSLTLLEYMLVSKDRVIYLLDNVSSVSAMEEPDIYKIKMHLSSLTSEDIYVDKVIPIFSEDDEARFFINGLFSYFEEKYDAFRGVKRFFYLPSTKISAENLTGIFTDGKLLRMTMRSICIVDGDHASDLSNCIAALPGKAAPEQVLCAYADSLLDSDDSFWVDRTIVDKGYSKNIYIDRIKTNKDSFESSIAADIEHGLSTKGKRRTFYKGLFKDNQGFFELLYKHWLHNPKNQEEIMKFYTELRSLFKKLSQYNDINPHEWK